MRRILVAVLAASLVLTLAACGGGGEEEPATTETPADAAPVVAEGVVEPEAADRSANDGDIEPMLFPEFVNIEMPVVIREKLDAGRPMLIFFYDDAQQVTATSRVEVDVVMNDYRGLVDLLTFSVGGDAADPNTLAAVAYANELGATSTPYIIIVDEGGWITWRCRGFAERGVIEREVERASR
ncbi:MAG: hypothetical protein JXA36_05090 [Coriobacteriia bacterium]|nr:hypothetical protein [Coriobacteriia bacterium]